MTSMLHKKIKFLFSLYEKEVENFENKKIKVSAVRARQALQELKSLIADRRQEIQNQKKEM